MVKENLLEDWKKCREIGERNFISIYGVLYFGSCMFAFSLFKGETLELTFILLSFTLCSLAGILFGKLVWFFNEKSFQKTYSLFWMYRAFLLR